MGDAGDTDLEEDNEMSTSSGVAIRDKSKIDSSNILEDSIKKVIELESRTRSIVPLSKLDYKMMLERCIKDFNFEYNKRELHKVLKEML